MRESPQPGATGQPTDWDPKLSGSNMGVWTVVVTPTTLLIGEDFKKVGGQAGPGFARFSRATI